MFEEIRDKIREEEYEERIKEALWVSPKRTIESPQDWQEAFGRNIEELIVDATERKHFRHKDNDKQKEHYSGKKNFIPRKTSS